MTLGGAGTTLGHIEAGKLKALAISRKTRIKALPQVPTLEEAGFPGHRPTLLVRPVRAGGHTARCHRADTKGGCRRSSATPSSRSAISTGRATPVIGSTAEEFAAFIRNDLAYKQR